MNPRREALFFIEYLLVLTTVVLKTNLGRRWPNSRNADMLTILAGETGFGHKKCDLKCKIPKPYWASSLSLRVVAIFIRFSILTLTQSVNTQAW